MPAGARSVRRRGLDGTHVVPVLVHRRRPVPTRLVADPVAAAGVVPVLVEQPFVGPEAADPAGSRGAGRVEEDGVVRAGGGESGLAGRADDVVVVSRRACERVDADLAGVVAAEPVVGADVAALDGVRVEQPVHPANRGSNLTADGRKAILGADQSSDEDVLSLVGGADRGALGSSRRQRPVGGGRGRGEVGTVCEQGLAVAYGDPDQSVVGASGRFADHGHLLPGDLFASFVRLGGHVDREGQDQAEDQGQGAGHRPSEHLGGLSCHMLPPSACAGTARWAASMSLEVLGVSQSGDPDYVVTRKSVPQWTDWTTLASAGL